MTQTITGLFDNYSQAQMAVRNLEDAGVPHSEISIIGHERHHTPGQNSTDETAHKPGDDASAGAGIGATVGGVGGLLAGLGLLAIPGIGPVVAAGWLAATAAGVAGGAVVGGAAGGLIGALMHNGVPEEDANVYAESVRRGGTLVTAKVDEPFVSIAQNILNGTNTVNVNERRETYEMEGWKRFDDEAPAYSSDQISLDRSRGTTFI